MLRTTLALAAGLLISTTAMAQDAGSARTQELLDTFTQVKSLPDEGELSAADRASNKATFAKLDAIFDFDTLTGTAIEPHKAQLSATQLTEFKAKFTEMIRYMAFPNAGKAFGESENSILESTATSSGGWDTTVELSWEENDLELEITFHWVDAGGTLRLVDVSFDGDSLIKDYQNQFGRILNKEGVDDFMKRLNDKHAEILEKRGGVL
jgi:ABC-type transporter MlaC component